MTVNLKLFQLLFPFIEIPVVLKYPLWKPKNAFLFFFFCVKTKIKNFQDKKVFLFLNIFLHYKKLSQKLKNFTCRAGNDLSPKNVSLIFQTKIYLPFWLIKKILFCVFLSLKHEIHKIYADPCTFVCLGLMHNKHISDSF